MCPHVLLSVSDRAQRLVTEVRAAQVLTGGFLLCISLLMALLSLCLWMFGPFSSPSGRPDEVSLSMKPRVYSHPTHLGHFNQTTVRFPHWSGPFMPTYSHSYLVTLTLGQVLSVSGFNASVTPSHQLLTRWYGGVGACCHIYENSRKCTTTDPARA